MRTFNQCISEGGNIFHIKDWLGHKKITTTLHYARIQNPEIAATLESHPINEVTIQKRQKLQLMKKSSKKLMTTLRRKYTVTIPIVEPLIGRLEEQIEEFLFSLTRFSIDCPNCLENGIEALRGVDIIRWLSSRRQAGISQGTIDKSLSHLRTFISYAMDRGWRSDNPLEALKIVPI